MLFRSIELARERLGLFARSRMLADPTRLVQDRRLAIEQHGARLHRLATTSIERAAERLGAAVGRLEAGSPLKILARGYSVTSLAGGAAALTSTAGVEAGDTLVTQLADGRVWSTVTRADAGPLPR